MRGHVLFFFFSFTQYPRGRDGDPSKRGSVGDEDGDGWGRTGTGTVKGAIGLPILPVVVPQTHTAEENGQTTICVYSTPGGARTM